MILSFHKEDSKTITEDNIQFMIESLGDNSFRGYLELEGKIRDFLNFVITKGVVIQSLEGFIGQGPGSTSAKILTHTYRIVVHCQNPFLFIIILASQHSLYLMYSTNKSYLGLFNIQLYCLSDKSHAVC